MREALEILANKAGVTLNNISVSKKIDKYDKLYEIYNLSNKFYQNNINTKDGQNAKEYLRTRGITDEMIKEFEIGLSLDSMDSLTKVLTQKGYDMVTLFKDHTTDPIIGKFCFTKNAEMKLYTVNILPKIKPNEIHLNIR